MNSRNNLSNDDLSCTFTGVCCVGIATHGHYPVLKMAWGV